jgi:carboxymethylenebutenolidase
VTSQDVTIDTADGAMRAYQVTPANAPRGAVIVIPEAFGVNGHIEDVTRRLANEGFVGLALDIFHRSDASIAPYTDFKAVMGLFEGLTDDGLLVDLDAAREHLSSAGFADKQIGIVGFCFGGRVSFLAGLRRPLGAAVSFYGGGITSQGVFRAFGPLIGEVADLKTPWLGLFGDLDKSIPSEEVETLRSALDNGTSVEQEIVRFPEADHAFHCDERPSYNRAASIDAWSKSLAWFGSRLT